MLSDPGFDVGDAPDLAHLDFVVGRGEVGFGDQLLDTLAGDAESVADLTRSHEVPRLEWFRLNAAMFASIRGVAQCVGTRGASDVVPGRFCADGLGFLPGRFGARTEPFNLGARGVDLGTPGLLAEMGLDAREAVAHAHIEQPTFGREQPINRSGEQISVGHRLPRNLQGRGFARLPPDIGRADAPDVLTGVAGLLNDGSLPLAVLNDGAADRLEQLLPPLVEDAFGALKGAQRVGQLFVRHGQILTDTEVAYTRWHEQLTCHATQCRPHWCGIQSPNRGGQVPKHADSDPVKVGYSSSRDAQFNSRNGADELGYTWGEWRAMSRDQQADALTEYVFTLVDVWVEEDGS